VITFMPARVANQDRRAACVHANTELDCFARFRSLSADRALELAYFVVPQRRKACRLPPPQHGEARSVVSPNIRGRGHYNDSPLRTWCLVRTGRPRVSTIKPRAKTAPMATTVHCRSV
jgi:hypothetical protein